MANDGKLFVSACLLKLVQRGACDREFCNVCDFGNPNFYTDVTYIEEAQVNKWLNRKKCSF